MGRHSRGSGRFSTADLKGFGAGSVIEDGVLVFHPENVVLGRDVYVGHRAILRGGAEHDLMLDDRVWVGEDCYFHAAGGITIGSDTGLAPRSMILTSLHRRTPFPDPIISGALEFAPVHIGAGCDVGMAAMILPGVRIGAGVQIGAGAVVNRDVPDGAIAAGVPVRVLGFRDGSPGARSGLA